MNTLELKNSPLTYVLFQIKISPILSIEDYFPRLQDAIRSQFPTFKEMQIQALELKSPTDKAEFKTFTQGHFIDKDNHTGIIIDKDSIIIHTTNYHSFNSLTATLVPVLDKFNEILGISLTTRIGMRYINFINSNVDKYVHKSLQGFLIENHMFTNGYHTKTESLQQTDNGIVKVQAYHFSNTDNLDINRSQYDFFVPPDLYSGIHHLSSEHHKNKIPQDDYLLLDIDHFCESQIDFSKSYIIETLTKLHESISVIFNEAVTKDALTAWK